MKIQKIVKKFNNINKHNLEIKNNKSNNRQMMIL